MQLKITIPVGVRHSRELPAQEEATTCTHHLVLHRGPWAGVGAGPLGSFGNWRHKNLRMVPRSWPSLLHPGLLPLPAQDLLQNYLEKDLSLKGGGVGRSEQKVAMRKSRPSQPGLCLP